MSKFFINFILYSKITYLLQIVLQLIIIFISSRQLLTASTSKQFLFTDVSTPFCPLFYRDLGDRHLKRLGTFIQHIYLKENLD